MNNLIRSILKRTDLADDIKDLLRMGADEYEVANGLLQDSNKLHRVILHTIPSGFWVFDREGTLLEVNEAYCNMSGYSEQELLQMKIADLEELESGVDVVNHIKRIMKDGNDFFESKHKRKDGTIYDVEVSVHYVSGNIDRLVSFVRDITDRKIAEKEQLKIQKLESLGVLAGGIAHDFNNLLTGILGNLSLIESEDQVDRRQILINEAIEAATRAANLTRKLLSFAKGGIPEVRVCLISKVIREAVEFANGRGFGVSCYFDLPTNLWPVSVDESQIQQVFQNLVINARQAMPAGGVIRITGRNQIIFPKGKNNLAPGGRFVELSVIDNGIGIPSKHLERIFEPYFTTKNDGSGLGLAVAYNVMKNHGGSIAVESIPGAGAIFKVCLPACQIEQTSIPISPIISNASIPKLKILVMDDQEIVREPIKLMLQKLGHEVFLTENGQDAIDYYAQAYKSNQPFDLIILDLTIPDGMGGTETLKHLRAIDPCVLAIISSGYSLEIPEGFVATLGKPYSMKQLLDVISEVAIKYHLA